MKKTKSLAILVLGIAALTITFEALSDDPPFLSDEPPLFSDRPLLMGPPFIGPPKPPFIGPPPPPPPKKDMEDLEELIRRNIQWTRSSRRTQRNSCLECHPPGFQKRQ